MTTEDQTNQTSPVARSAAIAGVIGAAVLIALLMFGGGDYRVTAVFENGGQLVKGNQVRIGGRPVGTVKSIKLDDGARAVVELEVEDASTPLHQGTTATVRAPSLAGIANRYVSLAPGPDSAPEIEDGGRIGADDTTAPVDLDQLFNALDPATRKGLQQVVQGSAEQYRGNAEKAAASLSYLSPALSASSRLTRELVRDGAVLERFLVDTSQVVGAIAERRDDLSGLVANANTAAAAIGDENVSLGRALGLLPGTLRKGSTTFVNLRAALGDLDALVDASKPATKDLAPFLRRLRPLVADARPTIRDLRTLIRTRGRNNDLVELTGKLPRLRRLTRTVFPRAIRTLDRSQETVETLRQYTPELAGWFTKFGQGANAYDANGHYARIQPMFSPFSLNDVTGLLSLVPAANRLDGFEFKQSKRCPGGAVTPPPDGSAPLVVPGCDPSTSPPGG